ncbi:tetratricopeptide repeat protein [Reticulibacter mediterranei]|uniref:Tetratricopeptide repeat protein n=1 Tax=Reticulibacter mediterranei TaxID=2778369 RepID=A0A8J3IM43_9CHLR|nr:FxSxx-COOH system tetratricopeptide repeat protein [Reticulibacter mediterranei]GHO96468.1 tetratricopeptide repeat protein [Reticulibacter mediterranei]
MPQSLHGERHYDFGQRMLTLRINIGLTQEGLAALLGITRKAVGRWEAGETYPKADHLKAFITLIFEQQGFQAGSEEEQIRALWRSAHQKVLLDEQWLTSLLAQQVVPLVSTLSEEKDSPPSVAEHLRLWTVPYARNPHFTGRDALLQRLEQVFALERPDTPNGAGGVRQVALTQTQAIKGLGGIGKTQTAIEYAYRARLQGRYHHVLWIAAASEETILTSFVELASLLPEVVRPEETDPRKMVSAILRWLEQRAEPWLLIFDNADHLTLAQSYFPLKGNGHLLLTTRASATEAFAPSLEVELMGTVEGAQLLLRRAKRVVPYVPEEIEEAMNIVIALAHFPLAIDQAGAYIEETGCNLASYLKLYQSHRHALLGRRGKQMGGYPESVVTTWSLSFAEVERSCPAATELLQLCAVLAPDRIPEELLQQGAPCWPEQLHEAAADGFAFNQMMEILLAFSLVKRFSEERMLSIHRLVQAVQWDGMDAQTQRAWSERAVRAVEQVFPQDPSNAETWPQCQRYLDQVQACDALIEQQHLQIPEAADLLDRAGSYFLEHFMHSQAEPLYQRALAMREQQWGAEHPQTANGLYHLALLHQASANFAQAEPLFERALAIRERQLGAEHLETAASLHGLAILYESQRLNEKGEVLARRALALYEQHLGADDLETVPVRHTLADVYWHQERFNVAEALYQHNLTICERHLGPEHPQTAKSLNHLALIYTYLGHYEGAEHYFRRVLAIREKHFGPAHYLTALVIYDLGTLSLERGRYEEAEQLFQQALALYEQHLGPQHVYTADIFITLANTLRHLGKYPQAEELARQALDLHEAHLNPAHHYIAEDLTVLGAIYREQGRYAEAEPLFQRAQQMNMQIGKSVLIPYEFALLREAQERDEQAYDLHQQALAACLQAGRTETHPQMVALRQHLATLQGRLGRPEEAANLEGTQAVSASDGSQA